MTSHRCEIYPIKKFKIELMDPKRSTYYHTQLPSHSLQWFDQYLSPNSLQSIAEVQLLDNMSYVGGQYKALVALYFSLVWVIM